MKQTDRIARFAGILRYAVLLILCALPLIAIFPVLTYDDLSIPIREEFSGYTLPETFATWQIVAYIVSLSVGLALLAVPLWYLYRLLTRYRSGETLSPACAMALRRIGQGLLAMAAFSFASNTLNVLALTALNPPGQRTLSFSITDAEIGLVLGGAVVVLVGWVMGQAADVAQENRSFV